MLFFRDHFLLGSSFIYRPPPCFPYHRSYRARPNDKTKPEKKKRKTGRDGPPRSCPFTAKQKQNNKNKKVFLNEMDRRYKIAEPFTKLTDWKGKNQQTRKNKKKPNRNINYNT
jgi:hypothetical protein